MHGSPLSKYDNREIWKKYDFNQFFYLTDTGRRWDGKYAVRDKVESKERRRDGETKRGRDEETKGNEETIT